MKINLKTLLLIAFTVAINSACSENSVINEAPDEVLSTNTGEKTDISTNDSTKATSSGTAIFLDDFNVNGIPDQTKWTLYPRIPGSDWSNYFSESYDQAYVKDGNLILKAEKVGSTYKTGGVWTKNLFSYTYGKLEIRAKFKTFEGGSPSLWILNTTSQPVNGEVDLVEQYDNEDIVFHTVWNNYTLNLKKYDPVRQYRAKFIQDEYNTYTLDWTPEKLTFYVNGKVTMTYPNLHLSDESTKGQWPFNKAFNVLLTFPISSSGINDSQLPGYVMIDWVKITQEN